MRTINNNVTEYSKGVRIGMILGFIGSWLGIIIGKLLF